MIKFVIGCSNLRRTIWAGIGVLRAQSHGETPDNNVMHAKSGLRVVLKWKIYRPDSVIAAVITLIFLILRFVLRLPTGTVSLKRILKLCLSPMSYVF